MWGSDSVQNQIFSVISLLKVYRDIISKIKEEIN